jgi:signal transduction histidine kinase
MAELAADRPERFLLVVDDNRDYADALCEFVALTSDWHPHAAYAVAEAVASALEHWPDAVLLDLQIPPCTGFDAADALEKALSRPYARFVGGQRQPGSAPGSGAGQALRRHCPEAGGPRQASSVARSTASRPQPWLSGVVTDPTIPRNMGLSEFIVANQEAIVAECEAFARTLLPAAAALDRETLRDHAAQILSAIAADMKQPQTPLQQAEKSKGRALHTPGAPATAAEMHGALRAEVGFDVNQTAAEYRALRAAVMRLWLRSSPLLGSAEVDEIVRFNEAMDQALAESILEFAKVAAHLRNLFLGVLSHELRTPLGTIVASARTQVKAAEQGRMIPEAADRVLRASKRMESLLNDLLDYVRSGAGGGLRVTPKEVRLDELCARLVHELESSHPGRSIELVCEGDTGGKWDEERIAQAVFNLLSNALKYGATDKPIRLAVDGRRDHEVRISVHNFGPEIPAEMLQTLFEPLVRGTGEDKSGVSLGLGLYIVRAIAMAHGGTAEVESRNDGVEFVLRLPRRSEEFDPSALGNLRMT